MKSKSKQRQFKLISHAIRGVSVDHEVIGDEIHVYVKGKEVPAPAWRISKWAGIMAGIIADAKKRGIDPDSLGSFIYSAPEGDYVSDGDIANARLTRVVAKMREFDRAFNGAGRQDLALGYFLEGFDFLQELIAAGSGGHLGKFAKSGMAQEKNGVKRAMQRQGEMPENAGQEWQEVMDGICAENSGITMTEAWARTKEVTGRKKTTMEKRGVTCPIPASRGPKRKPTP